MSASTPSNPTPHADARNHRSWFASAPSARAGERKRYMAQIMARKAAPGRY